MIDEESFIRTLLAEQIHVQAYIQSIVRRPELADDIFQEVCVVAMEKRGTIQNVAHFRNWLRTASRLRAIKALRKRRTDLLLLDEAALDAIEDVWRDKDGVEGSVYAEHLRQCVPLLSRAHRDLLTKRFVEGRDYKQLAVDFDRNIKSLYVTFSRLYAFLGKCIADRMSDEGGVRHA